MHMRLHLTYGDDDAAPACRGQLLPDEGSSRPVQTSGAMWQSGGGTMNVGFTRALSAMALSASTQPIRLAAPTPTPKTGAQHSTAQRPRSLRARPPFPQLLHLPISSIINLYRPPRQPPHPPAARCSRGCPAGPPAAASRPPAAGPPLHPGLEIHRFLDFGSRHGRHKTATVVSLTHSHYAAVSRHHSSCGREGSSRPERPAAG